MPVFGKNLIQRGVLMADKSKVTVRIFGTDYILCGSESEEYINNVAFNVDKMMREVAKKLTIKEGDTLIQAINIRVLQKKISF